MAALNARFLFFVKRKIRGKKAGPPHQLESARKINFWAHAILPVMEALSVRRRSKPRN
jgi:hypothetical protein